MEEPELSLWVDEDFLRIEKFLTRKTNIPVTRFFSLLRLKKIFVNGKKALLGQRLVKGDHITLYSTVTLNERKKNLYGFSSVIEENILAETEDFCVLNKPAGIAVQRGTNISYSLDECLQLYCEENNLPRYLILHRLDKETSGLLIFAKNRRFAQEFGQLLENRKVTKFYLCELSVPLSGEKIINQPLTKGNLTTFIDLNGKEAITRFIPLEGNFCLAIPYTGRTHQIRVHAQFLGAPLKGDRKYGNSNEKELKLASCGLFFEKYEFLLSPPWYTENSLSEKIKELKNQICYNVL